MSRLGHRRKVFKKSKLWLRKLSRTNRTRIFTLTCYPMSYINEFAVEERKVHQRWVSIWICFPFTVLNQHQIVSFLNMMVQKYKCLYMATLNSHSLLHSEGQGEGGGAWSYIPVEPYDFLLNMNIWISHPPSYLPFCTSCVKWSWKVMAVAADTGLNFNFSFPPRETSKYWSRLMISEERFSSDNE